MPDEEPTAEIPVVPTPAPAPKPAPPKPAPVVAKPAPKPEPVKAEPVPCADNQIDVYFEPANGLWYAQIGPDRPGVLVGQGRDAHEALAELASLAYRGNWTFDPSWKPGSK